MAKLATLIDDFQDGTIDAAKWDITGTVVETGGRARLTPTTSFSFLTSEDPDNWDLTLSQIIAHVPTVTSNGSTGSLQCGMVVFKDSNNWIAIRKISSDLECKKKVAGVESLLSSTLYSGTNHLFWRLRADATNIYWETSATGTGTFFIQNTASLASLGFALTAVGTYFFTGYTGTEFFPNALEVEAVNPGLPITASGASTSSGALILSIAGPVQITFSGASTSAGSLAISTVSDLDLTASGLSTSSGSFAFSIIAAGTVSMAFSGASTSSGALAITSESTGLITASAASTSSGSLILTTFTPIFVSTATWYFEPPVVYDNPPTLPEPTRPRYLNAHAKWKGGQARGRSVLKHGSVYTIVDTPTVDEMAAADIAYQGGHIYEVTAQEAYNLFTAGFNVYHGTDIITTESGDFITTESGDLLIAEYSFGLS